MNRPLVIVPVPKREAPVAVPLLAIHIAVLLVVAGSGEVIAQARLAHAVTARPVALAAPLCPVAKVERTP